MKEWWQTGKKEIRMHLVGVACALLVVLAVFLYWSQYKVLWFCDEIYSYFTANSAYAVGPRLEYGQWYDAQFVIDDMGPEHGRYFFRTRHNVRSDDHPPIYFLTMHLFSLLMQGSISKWVGLWINLICILGICVLSYGIFFYLTRNSICAALGSIVLCVLPSTLTNAMLIRMYCMVTLWATSFLLLTILLMGDRIKNKYLQGVLYGLLAVNTAIGFLTHYYFAIYAVGMTIFYGISQIVHKNGKKVVFYILTMMGGVALATILWPDWITQLFFRYCGEEVFSQAQNFSGIYEEIRFGISCLPQLMFYKGFWIGFVLVVCGYIFLVIKRDQSVSYLSMIFGTGLFYSILVSHVTPQYYLDYRYFYMIVAVTYIGVLTVFIRCAQYLPVRMKWNNAYNILLLLFVFNGLVAHYDGMSMGYIDRSGAYQRGRELLSTYSDDPWVVYGYENWTLMQTYYDLALGSRFIVFNDTDALRECPCKGEDYLFFFNNSFEYTQEELVELLTHMEGCDHTVEYLMSEGSAVYYVHHRGESSTNH